MRRRKRRGARRTRTLGLGLLVCIGTVTVGHATGLGGLAGVTVLGIDQTGTSGAPTVIGCDNFTGTAGTSLAGRLASDAVSCSNRVWTVHVGTWTIQSNTATSSSTPNAAATQDISTADSSTQVVLTSLNTGGRTGGVIVSHDGASNYLAAVMIDGKPDRVELRLYNAGSPTVLVTYNPAFVATNTLRLNRNSANLTLTLNGVAIGSYTMSSAELSTLGAGARAGLFGGHSSVGFDNFVVTTP